MSHTTKIVNTIAEMSSITSIRNHEHKVGFVPTMGFLHEGHLSLVKAAKENCQIVIVSIYINPSQFGKDEDLDSYPRNFEKDVRLLTALKVDYIFFPSNEEMYPNGYKTWIEVDELSSILCGKSRPIHFKGVATIVAKLINIVNPNFMYMGAKDFQQIAILKKMIKDLNFQTEIIPCPIVREEDGLAMSSRNVYLSKEERLRALSLSKSILFAKKMFLNMETDPEKIIIKISEIIQQSNGKIDYVEIINPDTLQKETSLTNESRIVLAVKFGKTRLIDNDKIGL